MRRLVLFVGATLVACSKQEAPKTDSVAPAGVAAAATASKVGEAANMKTPESVRYDPELDVFYVSNINGNPSQHDGNGFIAVIRADSVALPAKMLVEGGKNGAKLDAPKGMALVGDTLWVADINHVRGFNRRTGAPVADIDLSSQKAEFLNDVAAGPGGSVLITDTGIRFDANGGMSHPGVDQIFKIVGRKATALKADSLNAPNGIAWDSANSRWILGPFNGTAVQAWKEGDKAPTTVATGPGQYDGVEVLSDGRILVTSWADSAVHVVQGGNVTKLVSNVNAPADIGVDTKRNIVAIPRFNDGKVEFYKIP
ncbi:MAG TPA: SMP-30/gluconolactonase/LRE family protein [Gemmatimonadaceae bacterium]